MPPANNSFISENEEINSVALINALDPEFITGMREYFTTHGTRVYVNQKIPVKPDYLVIVGDAEFVKSIISDFENSHVKTLILSWSSEADLGSEIYDDNKLVFIEPRKLSDTHVQEVFKFFFTSRAKVLDLRTSPKPFPAKLPQLSQLIEKPKDKNISQTLLNKNDETRIANTINYIFSRSPKNQKIKKSGSRYLNIFLVILIVIIFPSFWYLINLALSAFLTYETLAISAKNNLSLASKVLNIDRITIQQLKVFKPLAFWPLYLTKQETEINNQEKILFILETSESAISRGFKILRDGSKLIPVVLNFNSSGANGSDPVSGINTLRIELDALQTDLGLVAAEVNNLNAYKSIIVNSKISALLSGNTLSKLNDLRQNLNTLDNLLQLFPLIAGYDGPKTYLVLLQNNAELRPTGGFIGSVGILKLQDGKISDLSIQDVYALDGQLKGHVDPPAPIRDVLEQEHWYLRDSNWDPDFSLSARQAQWFYNKESGQNVDGVIAINTNLLTDILKITGSISLPDYNDHITADNFYGKSLYYTQTNFFPGSTQKKDFIGSLTSALVNRLTSDGQLPASAIFGALAKALNSRDLMFNFNDNQPQGVVVKSGWSGIPNWSMSCDSETQNCYRENLAIIEANLGVNKVNYFIDRSIDYQIKFNNDNSVFYTLNIVYKNSNSDQTQVGGGEYRNYIRIPTPPGSTLTALTINGNQVPLRTKKAAAKPVFPYAEETILDNLAGLGVGLIVPSGGQTRLSLSFVRNNLKPGNILGQEVYIYKQPGISMTPVTITWKYPINWIISPPPGNKMVANPGNLEYNTQVSQDEKVKVEFTK